MKGAVSKLNIHLVNVCSCIIVSLSLSGPYFNGLKRSAKARNVKTVVGGSMAMLLLGLQLASFVTSIVYIIVMDLCS